MSSDELNEYQDRKRSARKKISTLSPIEKISLLADLQEQYFAVLSIREKTGGKAIPDRWRKWYSARHPDLSEQRNG